MRASAKARARSVLEEVAASTASPAGAPSASVIASAARGLAMVEPTEKASGAAAPSLRADTPAAATVVSTDRPVPTVSFCSAEPSAPSSVKRDSDRDRM